MAFTRNATRFKCVISANGQRMIRKQGRMWTFYRGIILNGHFNGKLVGRTYSLDRAYGFISETKTKV